MMRSGVQINAFLSKFGRHTPRILRKQLLCQLLEQYLEQRPIDSELSGPDGIMHECQPSFQRFHGTILFVDISGFTALSLRLNVEELKKHINEYFTMMLDIVDKHGGEVIKFAGDAIYILWQTPLPQKLLSYDGDNSTLSNLTSNSFSHDRGGIHHNNQSPQMKMCLEKAVMCGLEISAVCSNHRVVLDPATNPDNSASQPANATGAAGAKVLPGWSYLRGRIATGKITPQENPGEEKDVTYLNVHSGISNGLMAGIDVGSNDRWEYLLTGKPLARVAAAESQAHSGELVLCPFSHEMLHPARPTHAHPHAHPPGPGALRRGVSSSNMTPGPGAMRRGISSNNMAHAGNAEAINASLVGQIAADGSQLCSCGCTRTAKGFFRIPPKAVAGASRIGLENLKKAKRYGGMNSLQDLVLVANDNLKVGARIVKETEADIETLIQATKDDFKAAISSIANTNNLDLNKFSAEKNLHSPEELGAAVVEHEDLQRHVMRFMMSTLLDDVATHVHEVIRNEEFSLDPFALHKSYRHFISALIEGRPPMKPRTLQDAFNASGGVSVGGASSSAAMVSPRRAANVATQLSTMLSSSNFSDAEGEEEQEEEAVVTGTAATEEALDAISASSAAGISSTTGNGGGDLDGAPLTAAAPLSPKAMKLMGIDTSTAQQRPSSSNGLDDSMGSSSAVSPRRGGGRRSSLSTQGSLATMIRKSSTKRMAGDGGSVEMSAEIRSVVVMFIKIDSIQMNLWVDSSADGFKTVVPSSAATAFNYLPKTKKEKRADDVLLSRLQKCMEVVTSALAQHGGQLRQFIVDDKGTVAIGTFGLRGSRSEDNAAAALRTARLIIDNLQAVHVASQIGVTSGQGFCGLVGSVQRHEYAVMGPSTNLSARLMSKATSGQIMCDIETKKRDRTHDFEFISEVVAKGYKNKVPSFCPIFHEQSLTGDGSLEGASNIDNLLGDLSSLASGGLSVGRVSFIDEGGESQSDEDESKKGTNTKRIRNAAEHGSSSSSTGKVSAVGVVESKVGSTGVRAAAATAVAVVDTVGNRSVDESTSLASDIKRQSDDYEHPLFYLLSRSEFYFTTKEMSRVDPTPDIPFADNTSTAGSAAIGKGKMILHGRRDEIKQILMFLFPTLRAADQGVYAGASMKVKNTSDRMDLRRSGKIRPVFFMNTRARLLCVCAAEGYGKSALISSVVGKLQVLSRQSPSFNISIFRNRPVSYQQNIPFSSWKPILQEMFMRAKKECMSAAASAETTSEDKDDRDELQQQQGLDILWQNLPEQQQNLRPLLAHTGVIEDEPDNEHTSNLTTQAKLTMTADLIAALILQFPIVTQSCVMLVIEELQWLDSSSLMMLHKLWLRGSGIVVLASMRSIKADSNAASQQQNPQQQQVQVQAAQYAFPSQYPAQSGKESAPGVLHRGGSSTVGLKRAGSLAGTQGTRGNLPYEDPLRVFQRSDRFMRLKLEHLDRESTKALIKDSFAMHGVKLDDEALERVYDITGGNLLYAYEVTRSINESSHESMNVEQINEAIAALRCNRIEEVIYHRFDQMSSSCQLLLKTASVAGANGSSFSFALLLHVLGNSDDGIVQQTTQASLGSEEGLTAALKDVLRRDGFITYCEDSASSVRQMLLQSSQDSLTSAVSALSISHCSFQFGIRLEQLTIYGMLLDDQKEYLHEKVASYYYNISSREYAEVSGQDLCEEGFHWQKACAWAASMACYLRASEYLRLVGDIYAQRNYLLTAYTMFQSMCEDAGFMQDRSISLRALESLIADASSSADSPFVVGGDNSPAKPRARPRRFSSIQDDVSCSDDDGIDPLLTIESIYQIFGGDSDDLNYGLKVHIRLAQMNLLLYDDPELTTRILDDALQILLLSKNPYILNSKHFLRSLFNPGQLIGSGSDSVSEGGGGVGTLTGSQDEGDSKHGAGLSSGSDKGAKFASRRKLSTGGKLFCLRNYSAFCFPILSAYVQLNSWSPKCTAAQMEKALVVCEEALELAAREETDIFTIQLRCQEIMLRLNEGNLHDAAQSFRLLSKMYISSRHHNRLIALFGTDCVGQTMGVIVQYLMLHGDFDRAVRLADQQMNLLNTIKHNQSLAAAVIPISCALVQMGCREKALEFCSRHTTLLSHLANEAGAGEVGSFAIFDEWILRLVKFDMVISHHTHSHTLRPDSQQIDCLLQLPEALAPPELSMQHSESDMDLSEHDEGYGSDPKSSNINNRGQGTRNRKSKQDEWTVPIDDFLLMSGLTSNLMCAEMCLLKIAGMLLRLPPDDEIRVQEQHKEVDTYLSNIDTFLKQSEVKVRGCSVVPLVYTYNIAFFRLRKHYIVTQLHGRNASALLEMKQLEERLTGENTTSTTAGAAADAAGAAGLSPRDAAAVAAAATVATSPRSPRPSSAATTTTGDHHFVAGSMIGMVDPTNDMYYSINSDFNCYKDADLASTEEMFTLLTRLADLSKEKKFVFGLVVVGAGLQLLERDDATNESGRSLAQKGWSLMKQMLSTEYDRYCPKLYRIVEYWTRG